MKDRNEGAPMDGSGSFGGPLVRQAPGDFAPALLPEDPVMLSGAAAGPSRSFTAATLLRYKWSVLAIFLLVSAVAVPLVWAMVKPQYRATAVVRVAPVVPQLLYKYEDNGLVPLYQSYLQTQVAIVRNPVVLERVLEDERVQNTRWYKAPPKALFGAPLPPLQRLMKDVSANPRRGTELINISVTALEPADAKTIVDRVVHHYLNYSDTAEEKIDQMQMTVLTDKQAELRSAIEGKILNKNTLEAKLGTSEPDEIRTRVADRLVELEHDLQNLKLDRQLNRWRLDYLEQQLADEKDESQNGESGAEPVDPRYEDDPIWQDRRLAYEASRHQLNLAREHFGEAHPRMKQLISDADHTENLLRQREQELDDPRRARTEVGGGTAGPTGQVHVLDKDSIQRAIAEAEFREKQIAETIKEQRRRVDDVNEKAQMIERLNAEIDDKRKEADEVQQRLNVLRIEKRAAREVGRVTLASEAVKPAEPHRDRRALLSLLLMGVAGGLGVGVAFLRSVLDTSVREVGDVRGTIHIPFLGLLPKVRHGSTLDDESSEALRESVRMVRTALLDRLTDKTGRSVVVTSPGPQSGKTSVAILLARSLARVGKRVLLVDADLRRPSLSDRLEIEAELGLADLLNGRADEADVVVVGSAEHIDVILAGCSAQEKDSEMMANGVFTKCLERWRERYDFILFDAPPVLPVADARILTSQVDGAILTLRAARCRRSDAVEAIEQLSAAGGTTLGTILVGADSRLAYGAQAYHS